MLLEVVLILEMPAALGAEVVVGALPVVLLEAIFRVKDLHVAGMTPSQFQQTSDSKEY